MNDETKLPDWLAMPMRPAGGYGATICAHSRAGVDTTPCPFGPASRMPSVVGRGDELALRTPRRRRLPRRSRPT